jgi:hypothetical protein
MKTINKASHLLSKLAPPHTMAVTACFYSSIPIKGIPLLTFRNDPDEPMIENSSGTVKSGFWNPVYQNDCPPGCFMNCCRETTKMGVPPGNRRVLVPRRT